jgi:surface antigen
VRCRLALACRPIFAGITVSISNSTIDQTMRRSDLIFITAVASLWATPHGGSVFPMQGTPPSHSISLAAPPQTLTETDEVAALEMVQYALSEVGDGKTYVWRRWHGRLSGLVQPSASFKEHDGKVCRHLLVLMTFGSTVRKQEGIACRLPTGRWQLDG